MNYVGNTLTTIQFFYKISIKMKHGMRNMASFSNKVFSIRKYTKVGIINDQRTKMCITNQVKENNTKTNTKTQLTSIDKKMLILNCL